MASMIMNRTRRVGTRGSRGDRRPASVICPIDFSERGIVAMQYAAQMARNRRAKLIVVHVVSPADVADHGDDTACETALNRLEHFVRHEPGVNCEWVVLQGEVADQIVELASGCESPHIILATRGTRRAAGTLISHTAEQVLRRAPCPVVIVGEVDVAPPTQSIQFADYDVSCAQAASWVAVQ